MKTFLLFLACICLSSASAAVTVTGGATQTIAKGEAVGITGLTSGNYLCWTAATQATAATACAGVGTDTDAGVKFVSPPFP